MTGGESAAHNGKSIDELTPDPTLNGVRDRIQMNHALPVVVK